MLINKPPSMSVREWLIKSLSHRDFILESMISAIITHQYDSAIEALKDNNSIEISGFGKFYYNQKKADKTLAKFLSQREIYVKKIEEGCLSEDKKNSLLRRISNLDINIKALKTRIE